MGGHNALANSLLCTHMDRRASLGGQGPRPPQRAASGGSYGLSQPAPKRPAPPSRLSKIRSVSQPANVVDLTSDGAAGDKSSVAAFVANSEPVVKSPDVIDLEDDDGEPPAKRAKTFGERFRADADGADSDENDKAHFVTPGSPLPSLPKAKVAANRIAGQRRHGFGIDSASRKAHGLDPPAIAARVPSPKKAADFSPWTGNHPEDALNENVVKTGFFDKVQGTNQAESNSAKATISSSLSQKNNHGLSLLSFLFTAVLDKRQTMGKCTAPSAFKPPPRVTVTDTKREAWLRDLANPDVPLRKQSRTIPHGIRGKLLMEQCLGKDIPLQRAVWLAKCVGANELRAFRRKGVSGSAAASGESKWVREWTVHVEQFLEDVIATCGQEGWRQKMNYAVKLATAFYSEKLLDTEHYLDWVVSSLGDAHLERLPVWIVLAQVYWKEITMYGRKGRRLAEGILEHLHRITKSDMDTSTALRMRLQKLVAVLAVSNRGCLIIPRTWEKYKYLLTPASANIATDTPANNIAKRNERLASPMSKTAANTRSPLLDLYAELDSIGLGVNIEDLASKSLRLVPDISKLSSALLDWASTQYRTGICRVYLTARIIAHFHTTGYDTDSAILQYLSEAKSLAASSVDHVHQAIVELIRLEAFSTSRYLQWLITSGVLSICEVSTCATKLITALAAGDLPLHVRNTRNMLMRRLGYPLEENTVIDRVLGSIDDAVSRSATDHVESIELPEGLSLSAKFHISHQTCSKISSMAKESGIGLGAFGVARGIIENVEDVPSLAALVTSAATTDNSALLATVADTVNIQAESFVALGEFRRLVDALTEQYLLLRSQQPLDRTLILALTSLTQRIPEKAFVKLLNNDLTLCDQQSSVAVCSPASDSVIGMHASSLDSDDDIDAVFASGNTMDEQLMQRVFMRIMQRAVKPLPPGLEPVSRVCGWLNQLRSVEGSGAFEDLVSNHVRAILNSGADSAFSADSIVYLVASGCVTLGAVANMAKENKSPQVAVDVLPLFTSLSVADVGLHETERYRFRLQQSRCEDEHAEALSILVHTAFEAPEFTTMDQNLLSFIIWCISTRPDVADIVFEDRNHSELLHAIAGRLFDAILVGDRAQDGMGNNIDIRGVVGLANPLSVQYCVRALRYLKSAPSFSEHDESVLVDAVQEAFIERSDVWPQLLEFAGEFVNGKIHEWAQGQLLTIMMGKSPADDAAAPEHIKRCLDLLAVTSQSANITDDAAIVATITDRLKELEKQLSELECFDAESQDRFRNLLTQLRITLDLCVMRVQGLPNENEVTRQGRCNLLAALCALLVHPTMQSHQDVVEYLFDLSSTLSDNLPDAAQALFQQQTPGKILLDARLSTIFGTNSNALDSWLVLASQVQPPGSQQQRALNKHTSQQQLPNGQPVVPGQAQQSLQPQHQRVPSQGIAGFHRQDSRMPAEMKTVSFPLRRWEIMPEVMGENNTSLDLKLFGARKV